jgi:hypothetical protein
MRNLGPTPIGRINCGLTLWRQNFRTIPQGSASVGNRCTPTMVTGLTSYLKMLGKVYYLTQDKHSVCIYAHQERSNRVSERLQSAESKAVLECFAQLLLKYRPA